jgi:hypothetical protein
MLSRPNAIAVGLTLLVAGALTSSTALAATVRYNIYNGAAMCATAQPSGQSSISVRPYGIYNGGPAANYVSCSFPIEFISDVKTDGVAGTTGPHIWIGLWNSSGAVSRTVNCAVIGGTRDGSGNIGTATNLSVVIAPGAKTSLATDNIDRKSQYGNVNVSCLLPPGVELEEVDVYEYDLDNAL